VSPIYKEAEKAGNVSDGVHFFRRLCLRLSANLFICSAASMAVANST
jgi:hypothetical protein